MTSCPDANVLNLAVTGTFDDCQDIVKALFNDPETNKKLKLGAVNSINFARILAQIVYYFYSYFSLAKMSSTFKVGDKVRFVVPTGNFVCFPLLSRPSDNQADQPATGRYLGRLLCLPYGSPRR